MARMRDERLARGRRHARAGWGRSASDEAVMTTTEAVLDQIWVRGEDDGDGFGSARRARMGEA